jgi:hypothetical protein
MTDASLSDAWSADEQIIRQLLEQVDCQLRQPYKYSYVRYAHFHDWHPPAEEWFLKVSGAVDKKENHCSACETPIRANTRKRQFIFRVYLDAHPALALMKWASVIDEYKEPISIYHTRSTQGSKRKEDEFGIDVDIVNWCVSCEERLACSINTRLQTEWSLETAMLRTPSLEAIHALFTIPPLLDIIVTFANPLVRASFESTLRWISRV